MILQEGNILLVSHRRMFQQDESRFFLGRVVACEGSLVKLQGFSFARDLATGHVMRKDEERTKVLCLSSPGFIVYQLPDDVSPDEAQFRSGHGEAILVDGDRRLMNLSERTHSGHF
ncbi:MAG: hypothetical protein R3C19_23450 [Planctomycetaceae bacterium]